MALKQKKQNTAGGGLYIALAICVLSVICIGVYSAILNLFDSTPIPESAENLGNQEDRGPSLIIETPKQTDEDWLTDFPESEEDSNENVSATPTPPSYTLPVSGGVSKPFSSDTLVYSQTMNDYRVHNGVDLIAPIGTPVKAFTAGTVTKIYEDPLMGQTVVISHGDETVSIYQNLSPILPDSMAVGKTVREGEIIGGVGETVLIECAEEPHLHFEVTVNGKHVDPMQYFH